MSDQPILIIPARLAAARLPDKPMLDIHGEPMIVHVWRRAIAAGVGPVVVACGDRPIMDAITAVGGRAVLTDPDLPSGSDRVAAALAMVDPDRRHGIVVNIQGDLPMLDPELPGRLAALTRRPGVDMATFALPIDDPVEEMAESIVKVVFEPNPDDPRSGRALYFSRLPIPWGPGRRYHHIGLYGFRRAALERFVALPAAAIERRERLEQLRALAAGMHIEVGLIDSPVFGVDTAEDLAAARRRLAP
jgi:3-deoxy-manno-octulosonate cytidylyltransferase (CMP-KDO synthetase)